MADDPRKSGGIGGDNMTCLIVLLHDEDEYIQTFRIDERTETPVEFVPPDVEMVEDSDFGKDALTS